MLSVNRRTPFAGIWQGDEWLTWLGSIGSKRRRRVAGAGAWARAPVRTLSGASPAGGPVRANMGAYGAVPAFRYSATAGERLRPRGPSHTDAYGARRTVQAACLPSSVVVEGLSRLLGQL